MLDLFREIAEGYSSDPKSDEAIGIVSKARTRMTTVTIIVKKN